MILTKTAIGQKVLKDRSVPLSHQQRAAFILVDGKRTVDDILRATQAYGVTLDDIVHLRAVHLVQPGEVHDTIPMPLQRAA